MAAVTKGTFAYLFGVNATYTQAVVTSLSISEEYSNTGEVKNENGATVAKRYDDRLQTGSVTIIYEAAINPADDIGTGTITVDGVLYYIDGVSQSRTNNGYAEYTLNIRKYEQFASDAAPA